VPGHPPVDVPGPVVHLRSVSPSGVDALARFYWGKSIRPSTG
jgi:hypothetical protein